MTTTRCAGAILKRGEENPILYKNKIASLRSWVKETGVVACSQLALWLIASSETTSGIPALRRYFGSGMLVCNLSCRPLRCLLHTFHFDAMPLVQESHDALPYIDPSLREADLSAAKALVDAELPSDITTTLHPSVPADYTPQFSELVEAEHARIANGQKKIIGGIDLSRYEELEPPATASTSEKGKEEASKQWKEVLNKAYASHAYLQSRLQNLGLLETYGKNAWLISNSQLEDELRYIEKELAEKKKNLEDIETARRITQHGVKGEMETLEETWKKGVSRIIETEAAAEQLRQLALEKRRQEASGS